MPTAKVACYCRVSTKKEEQELSLENQRRFFESYAAQSGQEIYHIYTDDGISAKSMAKRYDFNRMLSDAKKQLFGKILVKDFSRFARNTYDFLGVIRDIKPYGVVVQFITSNMTTLDSELMLTVMAAMAQEESANLSKRVKFGKKQGAVQGRVPSRVYGYDKVEGDKYGLTINQAEAAIVRRIFDLYVTRQMSSHQIARLFNEEGVPTKNAGGRWSQTVICGILKNRLYTGQVCNGKSEVKDFISGSRVKVKESEWIVVGRPEYRIIPDKVFSKARLLIESRGNRYNQFEDDGKARRKRPSVKYPLSNLLVCANDNYAFRRRTRTYQPSWYTYTYWTCSKRDYGADMCNNTVKLDEAQMHEAVKLFLLQLFGGRDNMYKQLRGAIGRKLKNKYAEETGKPGLHKERNGLEKCRERLMDLYLSGSLDKEYLAAKIKPVEKRLAEITISLNALRGRDSVVTDIERCLSKMENEASNMDGLLENAFLKEIFERFIIQSDGSVEAVLKAGIKAGISNRIPFGKITEKSGTAGFNTVGPVAPNYTGNI